MMAHYTQSRRPSAAARDAVKGRTTGTNSIHGGNGFSGKGTLGFRRDEQVDWAQLGLFGAGLIIGVAVGAGAALLFAPMSGEAVRDLISERVSGRFEDLRDELRFRKRQGRKAVGRGVLRGRWAAEDALDRKKRKLGLL
ncbi:MAG: YtxH domain-containing protein [Gemmatimonadaceae bacterium]